MRIPESELIINGDGSIFHLHIRPEQLADRIVLVGDPGRVALFTPLLTLLSVKALLENLYGSRGCIKVKELPPSRQALVQTTSI